MTPTAEMVAMAERIARSLEEESIYKEARKAMLSDMTGSDIDYHLIRIAGERAALTAIMEVRGDGWVYKVQHGPDGETEYAYVFEGDRLVSVMRLVDAIKVATPSATGSI